MITFGFKNIRSIYTRAAVSFVLGLAFILLTVALKGTKYGLFDVLVMVTGAGIVLFGVIELALCLLKKDRPRGEKTWMLISSISAIVLGAVICGTASLIMKVFCVLIALFLLLLGIYQIIILVSALKVTRFSPAFFVLPGLVVIFGAVVLIGGLTTKMQNFMSYAAGASLMLYAASDLLAMMRVKKAMGSMGPEEQQTVTVTVEEVAEPEKVDEQ